MNEMSFNYFVVNFKPQLKLWEVILVVHALAHCFLLFENSLTRPGCILQLCN